MVPSPSDSGNLFDCSDSRLLLFSVLCCCDRRDRSASSSCFKRIFSASNKSSSPDMKTQQISSTFDMPSHHPWTSEPGHNSSRTLPMTRRDGPGNLFAKLQPVTCHLYTGGGLCQALRGRGRRVASRALAIATAARPSIMGLPARGGVGLGSVWCSPDKPDAVDQFVAREANGYKAEGFSRQRVLLCQ